MTPAPLDRLLPEPRPGRPYRIAVVCLGNICRSPIGEVVLTQKLAEAGLAGRVEVLSAGTGGWHVGDPMDHRAAAVLTAAGYDASRHRVRQVEASWLDDCDLVLAMDSTNLTALEALAPGRPVEDPRRVRLFRDFDPQATGEERDVPDPYFGGEEGFHAVLAMVDRTAARIVDGLRRRLGVG